MTPQRTDAIWNTVCKLKVRDALPEIPLHYPLMGQKENGERENKAHEVPACVIPQVWMTFMVFERIPLRRQTIELDRGIFC